MHKRVLKISFIVFFIVIIWYWFHYLDEYHVEADETSIEHAIENMINRGTNTMENKNDQIKIRKIRDIADKKIVFFSIGELFGESEFSLGVSGKYKIERVGHGTNWIRQRVIHTKEGTFFWVAGKKENIGRIKAFISDDVCDIQNPDGQYYIEICKIDSEITQSFADGMVIYDTKGKEISRISISKNKIID